MKTNNSKKTVATSKKTMNVGGIKLVELDKAVQAPSLADLVSGKGDAVAKAVADKAAKLTSAPVAAKAEKSAKAPAKAEKKSAKKSAKAPAKAEKKSAKKAEKKEPRVTSGGRIRELIMKGESTESILATIHKEFEGSKASASDVSWNRSKLRRDGVKNVPAAS